MDLPLDLEPIKDLLLERERPHLQAGQHEGTSVVSSAPGRLGQRSTQPFHVLGMIRVIGLEVIAVPVGLERGVELVEDQRVLCPADPYVPLEALGHGRPREVG